MPKEDADTRHPKIKSARVSDLKPAIDSSTSGSVIFSKECPTFTLARPNGCTHSATTSQVMDRGRESLVLSKFVNAVVLVGEQERHGGPKESDRRLWHDDLSSQGYRIPQTE